MPQEPGAQLHEGVHEPGGVDALPTAVGGQQAHAHVDPTVAEREDPAVAGNHGAVAVPDVEVGLDEGLVVAGGAVVARGAPCRGGGRDRGSCRALDRSASWSRPPPPRSAPGSGGALPRPPHLGTPALGQGRPRRVPGSGAVDERGEGLRPLVEGGSGLGRPLGHEPIEVEAGDRVAVAREAGVLGPVELEGPPKAAGAQAAVAVGPEQRAPRGPCRRSWRTDLGVSPSPQVLVLGNRFFSTTATSHPASASQ